MKKWFFVITTLTCCAFLQSSVASVLVQDDFTGAAGALPDATKFTWGGQIGQSGTGFLSLSTDTADQTWLSSKTNVTVTAGQTLVFQTRLYAYAENWNPGIYGDGQPRGLRVGSDANNSAEFYSISRTSLGLRVRKAGVQSLQTYALPAGVDSMHDYQISVTTTSVWFKVDGTLAGTITANLPTGALNVYVDSYDGGGVGNVPVTMDSVSLSLTNPVVLPPVISSFMPPRGPVGTSVTVYGTNFTGTTGVLFNGASATFSAISDTQIVATVPAPALSGALTVINPGGAGFSSKIFVIQTAVGTNDEASLDAALANNTGEIAFTCDGTIHITTTKLIGADTVLDATGHNITISGGNAVRVFTVNPGVQLTLRNLTVANGRTTTTVVNGQVITCGGGMENNGGIVTLVDCTFSNNVVVGAANGGNGSGGAINNENNGSLLLTNCTLLNNSVTAGSGTTAIDGSTGTGGTGYYGYGGGIYNKGGTVVIVNSTFSGNQAIGGTGGIGGRGFDGYQYWYSTGLFSGYWVTVPGGPGGNGGDGGDGFGGSLYNASGTVTMVNVTLVHGSAIPGSGGAPGYHGAYSSGYPMAGYPGYNSYGGNIGFGSGGVALKNTIVAYGSGAPGYNCSGALVDNGNNLCSDSSAGFSAANSYNGVDPLLAANVADNGGPTLTLVLAGNSPAINSGDSNFAPSTDQRHLPRAGVSDMGAYEFQTPASAISYAWLQSHGLPLDGSADLLDADGDGMNTLKEWIAGTDPASAGSCLRMLSAVCTKPGNMVSWQSVSGKLYSIQRSDGGLSSFVTVKSNIVGVAGVTTYVDTNAIGAGTFFYRVGVQQ